MATSGPLTCRRNGGITRFLSHGGGDAHQSQPGGTVPMTLTKSPLTKSLGQFVADLSPNRLPEEAARIARMGFIDSIGTMIAGRNEDSVRIMTDTLSPGNGPATLT